MNPYIYIFLISMLPFVELRGSIPYGFFMNLNPVMVFFVAIIGNMVPVPIILLFLEDIEKFLRKWRRIEKILDWIFSRTYKKANEKVRRWEYLSLIFFVAIPLPGTGAWTGSLIAYLFKIDIKKAIIMILAGVILAGIIVTAALYYGFLFFACM